MRDMAYSILIIKIGALGDVLRTTAFLKGLKERHKGSNISWLTSQKAKELLINNKLIDEIYTLENKKELPESFDLIISLDDEEKAAELATNLRKDKLIGAYLKGRKVAYTEDSCPWFDMGLTSRFGKEKADKLKKLNERTYQQIISEIIGVKLSEPILNLYKENIEFANKFKEENNLKDDDLIIGLNTGAGKRWPLKKWDLEKTAELADKLSNELNAKVILFGGPEEVSRNKMILENAKSPVIDAGCNNSSLEFSALIGLCDVLVCSDSLALHIAVALKKKVVALFGPTSAAEIELYGRGRKIIAPIDCYCCYKKTCDKKPSCMDLISADMVFNAVKELTK